MYQDSDWITEQYVRNKLSMDEIARIAGVDRRAISRSLSKLKIPIRNGGMRKWSDGFREKVMPSLLGRTPMLNKKHSTQTKERMSVDRTGLGNANWKGGKTFFSRKFRKTKAYRVWRLAVLQRDGYCCQYEGCGLKTNIAHHIKTAKAFPELRVEPTNGMAVCLEHHKLIHKSMLNGK